MATKKIVVIVLSVVAAIGVSFGVAGIAGVFSPDKNSSSSLPAYSSSQSTPEDSSSPEEQIELVPQGDAIESLGTNLEILTAKDLYLVFEGNTEVIGKAFEGVSIGQIAYSMLGEDGSLGYYSDGNWYTKDEEGNLKKCHKVLNAIFNYQIGGEPLNLSKADLVKYENDKLITYFEDQLGFSVTALIDAIPSDLYPGVIGLAKRITQITIGDFYNLTSGDYSYVTSFIEQTDVDEVTNLIFDILSFVSENNYSQTRPVMIDLFNGNLTNVTINYDVEVINLINAHPTWDLETKIKLSTHYMSATVATFEETTLNLDIDEIVDIVLTVVNAENVYTAEEMTKWNDLLTSVFDGTLKDISINLEGDIKGLISELLLISGSENVDSASTVLADAIKIIVEFAQKIEEQQQILENDIYDFIVSLFEVNEDDLEAKELVNDFASAMIALLNGSITELDNFAIKYSAVTLEMIDGYLNNAFSKIVGSENFSQIAQITLGDIRTAINDSIDQTTLEIEKLLEEIKGVGEDVGLAIKKVIDFCKQWVEENKDVTLGEFFGENVELGSKIANIKIGEILDFDNEHSLKLSTLDDILFERAVEEMLKGSGLESALDLTISDIVSIIKIEANQNALNILDGLTLKEIFDFVQANIDNEVQSEIVA